MSISSLCLAVLYRYALRGLDDDAVSLTVIGAVVIRGCDYERTSVNGVRLFHRTGIVTDKADGKLTISRMCHGVIRAFNQFCTVVEHADVILCGSSSVSVGIDAVNPGDDNLTVIGQILLRDSDLRGEEFLTAVDQLNRTGLAFLSSLDEGNFGALKSRVIRFHDHTSGNFHGGLVSIGLAVKHRGINGRRIGNFGSISRLDVPVSAGKCQICTGHLSCKAACIFRCRTLSRISLLRCQCHAVLNRYHCCCITNQAASICTAIDPDVCTITGIFSLHTADCNTVFESTVRAYQTCHAASICTFTEGRQCRVILQHCRNMTLDNTVFHRTCKLSCDAASTSKFRRGNRNAACIRRIFNRCRSLYTQQAANFKEAAGCIHDGRSTRNRIVHSRMAICDCCTTATHNCCTKINIFAVFRRNGNIYITRKVKILYFCTIRHTNKAKAGALCFRKCITGQIIRDRMALTQNVSTKCTRV